MIKSLLCSMVYVAVFTSLAASAAILTLDPDSYPSGADLTHAIPEVTLLNAVSADNQTVISSWYISAVADEYTSTGANVFGYLGTFHSLWSGRRLRMDFTSPVSWVSIDFISSYNDAGELHIFDSNWNELGNFATPALAAHQVQAMALSSPEANIAHAVAYSSGTGFGRVDNLQFAPIPEPSTAAVVLAGAGCAALIRRRRVRELPPR